MKKTLILIIFSFFINIIFSQTIPAAKKINQVKVEKQANSSNTEIFTILYEESKKTNTELLETFRWAIGSIIIIILAIFGTNIFFNFRFNKKELENLLQQIDLKIQNEKATLLEGIKTENESIKNEFEILYSQQNSKNEDFVRTLTSKVEETLKEVESKYQRQLDSFNNNYLQQINTLNDNFNLQIKTLNESYTQQIKNSNDKNDSKVKSLAKELESKESRLENLVNNSNNQLEIIGKRIKMDSARIKVNLWDHKGVYANSLTYRIEELLYAIEFKGELEFYLNDLIENLNKLKYLTKWDFKKTLEMINKITDLKYEKQKETIIEIINNKLEE